MERAQYRKARRLIRDHGRSAIKCLSDKEYTEMDLLLVCADKKDRLQERADIVAYCKRHNLHCTVRHTR